MWLALVSVMDKHAISFTLGPTQILLLFYAIGDVP